MKQLNKNDVIFIKFTDELKNHLKAKIRQERIEAIDKMKKDGWGVTKFGEPNPEFYGDTTRYFYIHFKIGMPDAVLTNELSLIEEHRLNGKAFMRVSDVINGKFNLLPLNSDLMDSRCFKYFKDFEFNVENYGKDFYKISISF